MNKAELVDRLAERKGLSQRDSRDLVDAIFDPDPAAGLTVADLVPGGNVAISGVTVSDAHNDSGPSPVPGGEALFNDAVPLSDSTDAATDGSWDTLAPGDTVRFTATYTVTQQDVETLQ